MDAGGEREHMRHRMDNHKVPLWNVISHYQMDEQNDFHVNTEISILCDERDAAIKGRDHALAERKAALLERDVAIQQRDAAVADKESALRERDNAIAALQFQERTMIALWSSVARGLKRANHPTNQHSNSVKSARCFGVDYITDALPISSIPLDAANSDQLTKAKTENNAITKSSKSLNKLKRMCEDLNRHVTTDGSKAEWDAQEFGSINLVHFDESTMPAPVCSCTGVPRQCYKWGSGGWQSSCCTTSLSAYPLPQMPNKKHSRISGRKMSGNVFSRLLTRVTAAGHDLSVPLDLKNYWAKHGTNRYITIK
ncbi:hypothetical protein C2S52_007571 [Perilla frutescens var. hirtella]|uniref:GAGA-binding transcriptional activator n=1 Tax=Perilla frutescens var. hirtella TaxID=608512 RepID=A0AAD4JFQ9_PERFH|nr:hypothetical protein C2S51_008318 [Perilla frutescens var. frutescens]KAH6788019.1 hypothetical protein C2S52_007571 [Perilla frutescens var. hirtella]KAH6832927.1 hypothetical protein C2S53_000470 [Perilla frutescens var. hirtella]